MKSKGNKIIPLICTLILIGFSAVIILPGSREAFKVLSTGHMYIMGFIKFALLATVGECIAIRLTKKHWILPNRIVERAVIWGLIGAVLALILKIYSMGIAYTMENNILPGGESRFLKAFYTSLIMNCSFGIVMMGFHKMTDKNIELKSNGLKSISISEISRQIDWPGFINFTVMKTIPFFWIPAHTITFMLPPEYQIVMAAYLSVALGIILGLMPKNAK